MRTVLLTVLCAAAFAAAAQAQMYRWTDDKGRVHVTDALPPASAKNVQKLGGATQAEDAPAADAEPYALQLARKSFPVTLYTTPGCEACGEARKLLNARGIPFKEMSVTEESQIEELKKTVGSASVPAMIVGATVQKGFEEGTYQRTLDAAGYPKTGALPPRNQEEPARAQPGVEVKPAPEAERPTGPYAPGAPPQKRSTK